MESTIPNTILYVIKNEFEDLYSKSSIEKL